MDGNGNYILEMENINKQFSGVKVLDNVQLKVKHGTVHALMGENGAGKSTLMKILMGIYQADSGTIKFNGTYVKINNVTDALKVGISMIHQELIQPQHLTVAEHIFLGREANYSIRGVLKKREIIAETQKLLDKMGINVNPEDKIMDLNVAKRQLIEITKAISYNSHLIIMDEPTSALSEEEIKELFDIIKSLKAQGKSFIFITHKLDEVFGIADYITVLRDGKHIGTDNVENFNTDRLVQMMVGRELKQIFDKQPHATGEVILSVRNLTKRGQFRNVSFDLHKGEILGIAGLLGAGRTELVQALFGVTQPDEGEVWIKGKKATNITPASAKTYYKMAYLTEDRRTTGLFLNRPVKENIIIANTLSFLSRVLLNKKKIMEVCQKEKENLNIKAFSLDQPVESLSGGNQQKVLISRWLLCNPEILILDEPTRGIDVGAKAEIYKLISFLANQGKAILMISSEMHEILGLSDRILVMHEGQVTGMLNREEASQEKIMKYAMGISA
ncbi:sugar ABC transporter ATP-binding protein [Moorella sp. E306M]|uniref:sugar ABC transporter ATP-binding protein n=1 Tax=Moorella sp. E306M TaxID=2572683 RepID=UPI0010FFC439|nr:sugar ABC transporter ATP-binding protein [Moorella sp. E306M]GEA19192.1 putative ribose/galactose/methyl galactoside import ATP-binding protein 2 [Moorella sp. E306M]